MNTKLLKGLIQKTIALLDEHTEIFFRERPWIDNPPVPDNDIHYTMKDGVAVVDETPRVAPVLKVVPYDKERQQNELGISKVCKVVARETKEPISESVIQDIFGN